MEYTGGMSLNYHSPSLKGGIRSPNNPKRDNHADFARCAASHGGGGLILFIKQNVIKTLPYARLKRGRESSGVVMDNRVLLPHVHTPSADTRVL